MANVDVESSADCTVWHRLLNVASPNRKILFVDVLPKESSLYIYISGNGIKALAIFANINTFYLCSGACLSVAPYLDLGTEQMQYLWRTLFYAAGHFSS
jgi:hypothetical protein